MRPEVTYDKLISFVYRLSQERPVYPANNTAYANTSQQLRSMVDHVAQMENSLLQFSAFVNEARNMITHEGYVDGTIKRAPKTNTLTGK